LGPLALVNRLLTRFQFHIPLRAVADVAGQRGYADPSALERRRKSGRVREARPRFPFTLKSLHLVDRNDPVCDIVARKVIEIDAAGTHDPHEIVNRATKEFGIPK
jgi:hypothetical protein